jgi:phycobilisome core linker protein
LQNTYFTKLVPYDNWFREQQRIMKMGGKIMKVELATGKPGANTGLL